MKKGLTAGCAFAIGMGAASFSCAADGEFGLGAGINYSTGKYGTGVETTIVSVPFIARYDTDLWVFKLTVPFLRVTSPGNVLPGVGSFNTGNARRRRAAGTTTASGIGDTTASATYTAWYDEDNERGLDLTGRVKAPSGDANKGLGTGSTDESAQVDVYQTFNRLTVFADIGYTHFGQSDFVQLDNALNYGIGASNKISGTDSLGASLDGRQRVSAGGFPQRELTFFWNRKTDGATRLQAYFLVGLAKGSPDKGVGVSLTHTF